MRHVIRTKGEEKCVGFLDVAKQLFDVALANYYSAQKKKGVDLRSWLQTNMDIISLFMVREDVLAILAAEGDLHKVVPQLRRRHDSGVIGELVFDFAKTMLVGGGSSPRPQGSAGKCRRQ